MKDIRSTIISNRKIADRTYEMVLGCSSGEHSLTRPGQFVNIRLDGFYLRRPISVCDWSDKEITIIYKVVGHGTEYMSDLAAGAHLDILTPLGNGYDTAKCGDRPLLVGGGAGVPPMYGLCKTLLDKGKSSIVILGFNTENELFYIDAFKALGAETIVTTADGSVGIKGFVTDAIRTIIKRDGRTTADPSNVLPCTYFYACGPEPMLKALDAVIDDDIDGQISFEERMGCGFGACMGCSCKTKYGNKRICKDGPVLERGEIIW